MTAQVGDVQGGAAAVTWSTDGQRLVFARQGLGRTAEIVVLDLETGRQAVIPLPELSAARDTITALAAVSDESSG